VNPIQVNLNSGEARDVLTTPAAAATEPDRATAPRWPRWVFRVTSTAAAIMLFNQAVFAGQFLDGAFPLLHVHRENATYAGIVVVVSAIAAVLQRWPGRGPWWPILASVAIFGLIAVQIILGFARIISVHIPLGVATIMLATGLAVWAWMRK
jgi:hypothetical protein